MSKTVLGIYSERENAEMAIKRLKDAGYNPKDVSIVVKDREEGRGLADDTGADVAGGAASGAVTGSVLGGLAGFLSSIALPGIGAFFIGGPIAALLGLTGAAAATVSGATTGAVAGGLIGGLIGLGLPKEEAEMYEKRINEGGILVAVPAKDSDEGNVEDILSDTDAEDVKSFDNPATNVEDEGEINKNVYMSGMETGRTPSYSYAGAKGGKSSAEKSMNKGRGWHGEPDAHRRARKGEDVRGRRGGV